MLTPYYGLPSLRIGSVLMVDQRNSVRDLFISWVQYPERDAIEFAYLDWLDFDVMLGDILADLGGLAAVW